MSSKKKKKKLSFLSSAKSLIKQYKRVLRVTKKPDLEELKTIVKISGIGLLIIGLIGFLLQMGWDMIESFLLGGI